MENLRALFGTLRRDRFALGSMIFLLVVVAIGIIGPHWLSTEASALNLRARNAPPFSLGDGWLFFLGADALGRSLLARIIVATQNTIVIAASAVLLALVVGSFFGLIAGFKGGWIGATLLRLADAIMSFPSMLLAVIVLYALEPGVKNVILVLAISRLPIYIRVVRAQVLEIKQRLFVQAAIATGASTKRILLRHVTPMILPTVINLAALEMAFVMLVESGLSFLGIGIQSPEITWGLMVADGRNYLGSAWWLSFWPGLAIMLVALSLNLLANWLRIASDPAERWRLETGGDAQ
ncbi:ABC transporter permease [Puniceibacterium sp. IMCC21224]|uniref:ABC transporter permease n=1 Tax=Puniceibacterium sp. IMCC21224 TaxID=1618204 RepID=UPI00064D750A|nr:ABC transporter permease [Puniceibacterium sp. IMCC21224]